MWCMPGTVSKWSQTQLGFSLVCEKGGGWRGGWGSLRITRTLIWLFYPLAWQRTKCIDSSAIAPPVSGMFFIRPTAKHSALWSSCSWIDIPGHRKERKSSRGRREFGFEGGKLKPASLSVRPPPIWTAEEEDEGQRSDGKSRKPRTEKIHFTVSRCHLPDTNGSFLRKIQAHCDILESTGIICSSLQTAPL